jgi:hypothetical protein
MADQKVISDFVENARQADESFSEALTAKSEFEIAKQGIVNLEKSRPNNCGPNKVFGSS